MGKPYAVAIVNDGSSYGPKDVRVPIFASRAACGAFGYNAPGWRAMSSPTLERAVAKLERHPGFISWA